MSRVYVCVQWRCPESFRTCATQVQTLSGLLSSCFPSCPSPISSLPHLLVASPGSFLPPSSFLRPLPGPAPSPPGLVRPLPHLTPRPGPGLGAPLDRDHSGACRTRAVEPRPALSKPSAPRAEARCSRRSPSHPGFSLLRPSG